MGTALKVPNSYAQGPLHDRANDRGVRPSSVIPPSDRGITPHGARAPFAIICSGGVAPVGGAL